MQLSQTLALVFAATTAAFPIIDPTAMVLGKRESIPVGQQSCTCGTFITNGNWYIKIGAPFDQAQVDNVCDSIQGNTDDFYCSGRAIDDTHIAITYQDNINGGIGARLNMALSAAWPSDVVNGFNCPDK